MQALTVTPGKVHQTKYGALPHADMIGRRFGTKVINTYHQHFFKDTQAMNTRYFYFTFSFFFMTIAY